MRNIAGHAGYAQPPQLFLNDGAGKFVDVATSIGNDFAAAKVGRGLAYGDFDRDGDIDLLLTTNNGPAHLYRNDVKTGSHSLRLHLIGTTSNRDGIGAVVRVETGGVVQTHMVKSGSSYLSQSELPLTFGLGPHKLAERVVLYWPSGRTEEFKNVIAGRGYDCTEGKGIIPLSGY